MMSSLLFIPKVVNAIWICRIPLNGMREEGANVCFCGWLHSHLSLLFCLIIYEGVYKVCLGDTKLTISYESDLFKYLKLSLTVT